MELQTTRQKILCEKYETGCLWYSTDFENAAFAWVLDTNSSLKETTLKIKFKKELWKMMQLKKSNYEIPSQQFSSESMKEQISVFLPSCASQKLPKYYGCPICNQ